MSYDIRQRRQLIAQRRRKLPPAPPENPDGTWLPDHERKMEVFITWEDLHYICRDMMDPRNAGFLGKMDWRNDPTYNMRRKK